jgi:hypothetical protein
MTTDILVDGNFDLAIAGGDFFMGESTLQHQQLLLLTNKGEIREFPTRGVGIKDWLLDDRAGDVNGMVKREFEADGMNVRSIVFRNGQLNVDARYE